MVVEQTPRPDLQHLDPDTRPTSPHHLDPTPEGDLEAVSSLNLPKPFVLAKLTPGAISPRGINTAITSLSNPDGHTTYQDAFTHPLTSYGSTTVRARPIKALATAAPRLSLEDGRPVVVSLPRSVSNGRSYDMPTTLRLKPLTTIDIDPSPRSIPILPPTLPNDHKEPREEQEHWDKTPKRSFDATLTARPHLVPRIPSTLSIAVPSLQSTSLGTVKPDTLALHRQLEEYNAVLAALTESTDGRQVNGYSHESGSAGQDRGPGLDVKLASVAPVDELGVEWCFFCGRERDRQELELVNLNRPGAEVGAGEQWICKGHCEGKIAHGLGYGGVGDWGSMRGEDGSAAGRVVLVQGMLEGGRDTEI